MLRARRAAEGCNNKRLKWQYQCNYCKEWFKALDVQVDHVYPCGTFLKQEDWATFGPNLFCSADKLQILCKPCHKVKTAKERLKC